MRIVVTGGAGFIGSCFVRELAAGAYPAFAGARVTVFDKLTYAGNLANLGECLSREDIRFVRSDICDAPLVEEVLEGSDLVVHFAAESHVDRSIAGADDFVRTNVLGTGVLLRAALAAGVGRFVHVSTDEVYGSIESGRWSEEQPLAPNSPYSATKASSDLLTQAYHRTHGMDVCVTRASNTYGPYQFPEKIIPLFITNLLSGRPVPLYGDGRNVRDWLHVRDHCRGVALVAERGRAGEIYHVGGGTELSNVELTELLLAATGAGWEMVRRVPDRKGHDLRYALDHGKAARELGYRPQVPMAEGLAETVRWYRENRFWWEPALAVGADG